MAEQFANKIRTTLAANYTAGSGTCTVTDATGMPATGDFRLRLGNVAGTILKVTARAGAVLTVTPEQDDGNAVIGDLVRLVPTAGAMLALKADAIAGAGGFFGYLGAASPLDQSTWAWVNQGSATISQSANLVYFLTPTNAGTNVRFRKTTAPATPYTVTVAAVPNPIFGNSLFGIGFRESATGKLCGMTLRSPAGDTRPLISARRQTNPTTFASQVEVGPVFVPGVVFFRITADGTNVIYQVSFDGNNFVTALTEAKNAFFTTAPDEYGLWLENFSGVDIAMSIPHFKLT